MSGPLVKGEVGVKDTVAGFQGCTLAWNQRSADSEDLLLDIASEKQALLGEAARDAELEDLDMSVRGGELLVLVADNSQGRQE